MSTSSSWLEINHPEIDKQALQQKIEAQVTKTLSEIAQSDDNDPQTIAQNLWQALIGPLPHEVEATTPFIPSLADCDIVPRNYNIEWQHPVLGPINATIRQVINEEIRRYLLNSLEKQSALNRQISEVLQTLMAENKALKEELNRLQHHNP